MRVVLELDGDEFDVVLAREGDKIKIEVDGEAFEAKVGDEGVVQLGDARVQVRVGESSVHVDGREVPFRIHEFSASALPGGKGGARGARVKPPMPGKIVSVGVKEGDEVEAGAVLVILEAMKMQNEITAPAAGTVKKVHVSPGQNVESKDVLIELE